MARRSAAGKQEQAKRTRAAAARTSKRKGKAAAAEDEASQEAAAIATQDEASQETATTEPSSDVPESSAAAEGQADEQAEHTSLVPAPKTPTRSPRKPRGKGKQKADEPVPEQEQRSSDVASSSRAESSMQSSMDSEAEVAAAFAAQAIAKASDDDVKASSSTFDKKASSLYMVSPSSGKATPARQKRRLNSRAASSPYAASDATRTPKSSRGPDEEEPRNDEYVAATPRPAKTRSARLSQAAAQSPRSPAMRALQSIAGLLSPWRSSRAQQSAAFGHIEDDIAEDEPTGPSNAIAEEGDVETEKPTEHDRAQAVEVGANHAGTSDGDATKMSEDIEEQELAGEDAEATKMDDTQSIYPSLPSAPLALPIATDETVIVHESQDEPVMPQAAEQRAASIEPIAVNDEVQDVSFASIAREEAPEAANGIAADGFESSSVADRDAAAEMHLPSVPHSPPHSLRAISVQSSALPSPQLPRHATPKSEAGVGFGSATPFAAAQNGFGARSSYSPFPAPMRSEVDVFSFGRQSSHATPQMPLFPRRTIANKPSSPLSKNFALLSRFFAEKAAAEEAGEGAIGDGAQAFASMSQAEYIGCKRLIEESYAQGRGAEVERLRVEAIERGGLSRAPSSAAGPSSAVRRANGFTARMSRSPSLPLGAAADELPIGYDVGMRSRPSTSFLAPAANFGGQDQNIGRSLAHAFAPASVAPQRRHRPLYLGPGVSASSSSSDALRRNQLTQQRRAALQTHRRVQQEALAAANEKEAQSEAAPKRRRLHDDDAGQSRAQPLPSTAPEKTGTASTLFHKSAINGTAETVQQAASTSPANAAPQRTLTADAMLSILRSGPSIPSRSTGSTSSPLGAKSTRTTNPDLVNPYESDHRRIAKRTSIAPSSSLVAKEKERLKEERERRQREALERKNAKRESTLELIERTAPLPRRNVRRIRLEPEDEEEDEPAQANTSNLAAATAQSTSQSTVQADRDRKTQEVQKRLDSLKAKKTQVAPSVPPSSTQKAAATPADKSKEADTSSSAPVSSAPKPFAFGSSSFAPKKPSPLSQAGNTVLDSPSSASEASVDRDYTTSRPSPASPSKPSAASADTRPSAEKATPPASSAPATANTFSFSKPTTAPASASKPATQPLFSFGTTPKPATPPTVQSTSEATKPPASAREQAQSSAAASLPSYDFELSVLEAYGNTSGKDGAGKSAALAAARSVLPTFDFFGTAADAVQPKAPFDIATAAPASTNGFAFKPVPAQTSHQRNDDSENDASHDSQTAANETISDKSTSALLSGVGEGEEEEDTMHDVRCKVWSLESGKWNDLGIGSLKLKKHQTTGKRRVLVRNEGNGKVTINFRIMPTLKPSIDKNVVSFLGFTAEGKPMNYRCKIKTEDSARSLKEAMEREAATTT